jgi:hypothetical protein
VAQAILPVAAVVALVQQVQFRSITRLVQVVGLVLPIVIRVHQLPMLAAAAVVVLAPEALVVLVAAVLVEQQLLPLEPLTQAVAAAVLH